MNIGTPELLIVLVVALLFFGPAKLPGLARSLGEAQREFRSGSLTDQRTTSTSDADADSTLD